MCAGIEKDLSEERDGAAVGNRKKKKHQSFYI